MAKSRTYREAERAAKRHFGTHRDRMIFLRQMGAEANFGDPTSPAGAQGPAQIMPGTARAWGVRNVHDPRQAFGAAASHMAQNLRSTGSWSKALQIYNAGHVMGRGMPAETRNYIAKILKGRGDLRGGKGATAKAEPGFHLPGTKGGGTPMDKLVSGAKFQRGSTQINYDQAIVDQLLHSAPISKRHGKGGSGLLSGIVGRIESGAYTTATPEKFTPAKFKEGRTAKWSVGGVDIGGDVPAGKGGKVVRSPASMVKIAEAWARAKVPYAWGGGHGSSPAKPGTPVDCSGYVSAILGISPRVSGALAHFGQPGPGKVVTIYAHSGHVLIKIGKRWYATSHQNPGGGAGRISPPTRQYLAAFQQRHPRGM